MSRPLIIGHRGAPGYRPEHTRGSYELAIEMGVDAVEPDIVVSNDGILVIRHENELSTSTDVADHPEFAQRRTTKRIDGLDHVGWFAEDFTWDELATLRCRERIPGIRPGSASFDDREPPLRLRDLLALLDDHRARGREVIPVIEVKHASYFAECGHDMAALLDAELASTGWKRRRVVIESFELTILRRLRERGTHAELVFLLEAGGIPADQLTDPTSRSYTEWMTPEGLDVLAAHVDGISPDKTVILAPDAEGRATGPAPVVARAHERGLAVFTWTCRPENAFLLPPFRTGDLADYGDWRSEWAVLARAGLDGVFVDHADLGVEVFGTEPIGEGG
ncbi:glycerophosphodiester phosphodiesterase family protein [Microbacterium sp.]|uniref:glycerophosphodiester phosphodiesterase family protein n=1 Tax=Microbacterium sp. TaxID=51671 RepID=UPI000C648754|nr:glycerophosphodiester phosphodiesterase family protein [Microbacterium sp.]MBU19154.1 glycerophosphodiester phosphodiesterase [Microbacterium sp.]MEC8762022.1 glycerophosphodiester phosphodiesterase family protein [Actinomycetota bacterium]